MKELFIVLLAFGMAFTLQADPEKPKKPKKPTACHPYYCNDYDWDHELKRFDPLTIRWPLHYDSDNKKDIIDGGTAYIDVVFNDHKDTTRRLSLAHFRYTEYCPDPNFLKEGIDMDDAFICQEYAQTEPSWDITGCSMVGASVEDQLLTVDGGCAKKVRKWTVIDWCKWEPNGSVGAERNRDDLLLVKNLIDNTSYFSFGDGYQHNLQVDGYYTFTQVVKIIDDVAPELVSCEDMTYDLGGECEGEVFISNKAIDNGECSGDRITISVEVYNEKAKLLFNEWFTATRDQDFSKSIGHLPIGEYYVYYLIKDACGNFNHCNHKLIVTDLAAPPVLCIETLSTSISDSDGMTIWAQDFILKTEQGCADGELTYSFFADSVANSMTFDCDSGQGFQDLTVYVTDSYGNQSTCGVELFLTDNYNCDPNSMSFGGMIFDRFNQPMADVMLGVKSAQGMMSSELSNDLGRFYLKGVPITKSQYTLDADVGDDPKDGLDAFDLIALSRHIYGSDKFEDVLEYAAADINNDAVIDMKDYWSLAALLYDVPYQLVDFKPWKYIDHSLYRRGVNRASKLTVPIDIKIHRHRYDVLALKSGDIDFSWTDNPTAGSRSVGKQIELTKSGNTYSWDPMSELSALALTISGVSLDEIYALNPQYVDNQLITMVDLGNNVTTVFYNDIELTNIHALNLGSRGSISTRQSKSYFDSDDLLQEGGVVMVGDIEKTMLSISPNPFVDELLIKLDKGDTFTTNVQIFNAEGRIIHSSDALGSNQLSIKLDAVKQSGLLFIHFDTTSGPQTRKIIRL